MQLQNTVSFVACGVSARVHRLLHSIGLTSSQSTALDALDTLRSRTLARNIAELGKNYVLRPFLCFDNIDIQAKVHRQRMDTASQTFHGTWGFFHVLSESMLSSLDPSQVSREAFDESMEKAATTPVEIHSFLAKTEEVDHWRETVKCQLWQAVKLYICEILDVETPPKLATMPTVPPTVDQISMEPPNILMLMMMDAPDNSAGGVARVFQAVLEQIRRSPDIYSKDLNISEGDVGTGRLIEALRGKRFPAGSDYQGLDGILSVMGLAHMLWNLVSAGVKAHYGDTKDAQDGGAWRARHALGGKTERDISQEDFGSMMTILHDVHFADLVLVLR